MTPTALKAGFASAVLEADYQVELAGGGGNFSSAAHRFEVAEFQKTVSSGTLNLLYINLRRYSF
jgi:fatty acid synthase subunit alpha, fungi type